MLKNKSHTKTTSTTKRHPTTTTHKNKHHAPKKVHTLAQRYNATASTPAKRIITRASSKLSAGLCGLPNIGKSLIYNCLSEQNVPSENYPFCTIDPSSAVVPVPDDRLEFLKTLHNSQNTIHSTLTITDIAGLVKGASEGAGLGSEFLSNIQATDAIFHLVRLFGQPPNREVIHVEGSINPVRDMEIISEELLLRDKKHLTTTLHQLTKKAGRQGISQDVLTQLTAAKKAMELLEKGMDVREGLFTQDEADALVSVGLLTAKPVVYILNCSTEEYLQQYSPSLKAVREWINKRSPGSTSILFSGDWEADLALTPPEDREEYVSAMIEEYPLHAEAQPLVDYGGEANPNYIQTKALELREKTKSMLPVMIASGYSSLNLIQYFTAGPQEVRSWTIPRGATAQEAAGVIHTDFFKNFVAAEVIAYADVLEHKDEEVLKKLGKVKTQGKAYIAQDGDVMVFKTGVGKK